MSNPATETPPPVKRIKAIFTVELGDEKNRNFMSPLFGERTLRGRWSMQNQKGGHPDDTFLDMPNLPGMYITVNTEQRLIELTDPLASPRHKALLEKARRVCKARFNKRYGPDKGVRIDNASEDELKNACYWVRRLLDARQATVVSGAVPEMKAIVEMPGSITFEKYDQREGINRQRPPKRYVPLPVEGDDHYGGEESDE